MFAGAVEIPREHPHRPETPDGPRLSVTVPELAGQDEAFLHERDPRPWVPLDRPRLADVQECLYHRGPVAEGQVDVERLLVGGERRVEVALPVGDPAEGGERPGPGRGGLAAGRKAQGGLEPPAALLQVPVGVPESPDRPGHPEGRLALVGVDRPPQAGAEVVVLPGQLVEPTPLVGPGEVGTGPLR
jgi:hypothetical protein